MSSNNNTSSLCTSTIVGNVTINVDKKDLLSSIEDDSDIELSIVGRESNKETVNDSADPSIIHDHHEPPVLVPIDYSYNGINDGVVSITDNTPFFLRVQANLIFWA